MSVCWQEAVLFRLVRLDEQIGYDVELLQETATLAQYLAGLNALQEKYFDQCYGCDGCCWERAPLNGIDILRYVKAMWPEEMEKAPYGFFLKNYAHVHNADGILDISLKRGADGACVFLNKEKKCCNTHQCRSLVCQSYICIPQTERAELLRQQIVNAGIDDLARRFYLECKKQEKPFFVHSGDAGAINLADYPENGFSGKTDYDQVLLKDVITADLLAALQAPCSEQELK